MRLLRTRSAGICREPRARGRVEGDPARQDPELHATLQTQVRLRQNVYDHERFAGLLVSRMHTADLGECMTCAEQKPSVRRAFPNNPFMGCGCARCERIRQHDVVEENARKFIAAAPRHVRRQFKITRQVYDAARGGNPPMQKDVPASYPSSGAPDPQASTSGAPPLNNKEDA